MEGFIYLSTVDIFYYLTIAIITMLIYLTINNDRD